MQWEREKQVGHSNGDTAESSIAVCAPIPFSIIFYGSKEKSTSHFLGSYWILLAIMGCKLHPGSRILFCTVPQPALALTRP